MTQQYEALLRQVRESSDMVRNRLERGTDAAKRECEATLAAIRDARASLDRWEASLSSSGDPALGRDAPDASQATAPAFGAAAAAH